MRRKLSASIFFAVLVFSLTTVSARAGGLPFKLGEDTGETIQTAVPLDRAYDQTLNLLQKQGYTFEPSTRKDLGQIVTTLSSYIAGKLRDAALRIEVIFVRVSDNETVIKVSVAELFLEPGISWTKRGINAELSKKLAADISAALK